MLCASECFTEDPPRPLRRQSDTHSVGLLWTIDQPVTTYTKHNKRKRSTSMPSAALEPWVPTFKLPQTVRSTRST
jgi:hypothetical protein